jgi:hypothetical protein
VAPPCQVSVEYGGGDCRYPVVCQNSADRLSGPPFVVVKDPTPPFMADDGGIHVDHALPLLDQPTVEPLMIPLDVLLQRPRSRMS